MAIKLSGSTIIDDDRNIVNAGIITASQFVGDGSLLQNLPAAGISLTDISVTTNSAGTAALSYNNATGAFSYTPPDLSGYLTSIGSLSINALSDVDTVTSAPSNGQALVWSGSNWIPGTVSGGGGGTFSVQTRAGSGGSPTGTLTSISTLSFNSSSGFSVSDLGSGEAFISLGSAFAPWSVSGQTTLTPSGEEEIEFIAGSGIQITTNATSTPKSITFTATGGGGGGVTTLDGLTDVDVSSTAPTDGQALIYSSASSLWIPGTVSGGGGGSSLEISNISGVGGATSNIVTGVTAARFHTNAFSVSDQGSGEVLIDRPAFKTIAVSGQSSVTATSDSANSSTLNLVGSGIDITTTANNRTITLTNSISSLTDLSDVNPNMSPSNGQVLKYSTALGKWTSAADSTGADTGGVQNPDEPIYAASYFVTAGYWSPSSTGAIEINGATTSLESAIDQLNVVLGKLAPSAPPTMANKAITTTISGAAQAKLCTGVTTVDNTDGLVTATPGTAYNRVTSGTISTTELQNIGPGDSGTVYGYVNTTVCASKALSTGDNSGTYNETGSSGSYGVVISSDRDASAYYNDATNPAKSVNGKAIPPGFFEIFNVKLNAIPVANFALEGFNYVDMKHVVGGTTYSTTGKESSIFYYDQTPAASPSVSVGPATLSTISSPAYSSGIPHAPASFSASYDISVSNLTGNWYLASGSPVTIAPGSAFGGVSYNYTDFGSPAVPPAGFLSDAAGSKSVTSTVLGGKFTSVAGGSAFGAVTASSPYGTGGGAKASVSDTLLLFTGPPGGSTPLESGISASGFGTTPRVLISNGADNPPVSSYSVVDSTAELVDYEAAIVAGVLKHDTTNYSTGYYPVGPNYSAGRSGAQYATFKFNRAATTGFTITVTGSFTKCWVCLPQNTSWMSGTSFTNGWADTSIDYAGAGIPGSNGSAGCAVPGKALSTSGGTGQVNQGQGNTTGGWGVSDVLIRFKLSSGQSITGLSLSNPV